MPYSASMEPLWLSIAGDAGSALGGLTVFGAGIGYLLNKRKQSRDARMHMAVLVSRVFRAVQSIQHEIESWTIDSQVNAKATQDKLFIAYNEQIGPLETQAQNESMRKVARVIDGMMGSLRCYIMLGNVPNKRAEAVDAHRKVGLYLMGMGELLKRRRGTQSSNSRPSSPRRIGGRLRSTQ